MAHWYQLNEKDVAAIAAAGLIDIANNLGFQNKEIESEFAAKCRDLARDDEGFTPEHGGPISERKDGMVWVMTWELVDPREDEN